MAWTAVTQHRARLGEGPFWDGPRQALYWVDIAGKQALRLMGDTVESWQMPEHVSAFIPCASGDALVTLSSGVYRLDLTSEGDAPRLKSGAVHIRGVVPTVLRWMFRGMSGMPAGTAAVCCVWPPMARLIV